MKQRHAEFEQQKRESLEPKQPARTQKPKEPEWMEQEQSESISPKLLNEKIADASRTIFSYCMAKTPNRLEAEDLCQDILLELIRSSGSIRDSGAFYGFMWAVAGNVYKHWCRKKARPRTCELTEDIPAEESALDKALAVDDFFPERKCHFRDAEGRRKASYRLGGPGLSVACGKRQCIK